MRRLPWLFALVFLAGTLVAGYGQASLGKRVALVVGNGAYKNTIDLPNAPADAKAVAESLRRLGFLVIEGLDLNQSSMTDKLKEFSRALNGAEVGLFYYAGHGLQVGGENYLVPIDAVLKRDSDLEFETVKVDAVLRQLSREAKVKILILDACRDNPLAQELARSMTGRSRSTGVAAGMGAIDTTNAAGTMIAFATAPGTVALDGTGRHSPFTESLLRHMETADLDIDLMMKRVRGDVTRTTNNRQQPWTNSSLTAEFHLNPTGTGGQAPATVVASLPGGDASAARGAGTMAPAFDPRQMEFELWRAAQAANTARAYQGYIEKFPTGTFTDIARDRLAAFSGNPQQSGAQSSTTVAATSTGPAAAGGGQADPSAAETQIGLDESKWRDIQRRLSGLGFSTRGIDGNPGRGTRSAIERWQSARGHAQTGYLNDRQHAALLAEPLPKAEPSTTAAATSSDEDKPARTRSSPRPSAEQGSSQRAPQRSNSSSASPGDAGGAAAAAILGGIAIGVIGSRAIRRR